MKNLKIKCLLSLLLVSLMMLMPIVPVAAAVTAPSTVLFEISNPYAGVNWATYGQFRAAFHQHTWNSDGNASVAQTVEDHFARGFDILAIADHNFVTAGWDGVGSWGADPVGDQRPVWIAEDPLGGWMAPDRIREINAGIGRDGRGMISITHSNEQSVTDHIVTLWANFNNVYSGPEEERDTMWSIFEKNAEYGGIAIIAHPGRYLTTPDERIADNWQEIGAAAANNPENIQKYVDFFLAFPESLVGMEIMNRFDNETRSDRILWDNILMRTMPEGVNVWGFSNDDSHSFAQTGYNFNVMLMPELTEEATRAAMEAGAFYAVGRVDRRAGVNDRLPNGEVMPNMAHPDLVDTFFLRYTTPPSITNIVVAANTITISGADYDVIEWIADGVIIAEGTTLDLSRHVGEINSYVRAQLKGEGGIAYTQPFGVRLTTPAATVTASPTTEAVIVNGESIEFGAYNINGNNFFKLRDIAYALNGTSAQFNVGWNGISNVITLSSGQAYSTVGGELLSSSAGVATATLTSSTILLNGAEVNLTAYRIGNNHYFMLRDLGASLGFSVDFDDETRAILIDTD